MTIQESMQPGPYPRLAFRVDSPHLAQFFLLLQRGVGIRRHVGCSVEVFLQQQMGISLETIEKIQSIMLDGKPVDDIKSALVHDGSTLALSAAMPGLVGATLRRGGAYASFRSGITYHETDKFCTTAEGWVRVKVFNLLLTEMGPSLFRTGILVRTSDLLILLKERADVLRQGTHAVLDDMSVDLGLLEGNPLLAGRDAVFLTLAHASASP